MATTKKTGKIVITILIISIVLYLVYVYFQKNQTRTSGGNEWHNFEWGGSQRNGTEVLLCCTDNIQNLLSVGDRVELEVGGCETAFSNMIQDPTHICTTKTCVCRGDLSGVHEVVGFGDDTGSSFADKGFRIQTTWEGSSSPTPSIISGKWRKVAHTNWW